MLLIAEIQIRWFGIVLVKLLLCGEAVDDNLYSWESNSIRKLECSFEPYWWLVENCFLEYTPTQYLVDFIFSIIGHMLTHKNDERQESENSTIIEK